MVLIVDPNGLSRMVGASADDSAISGDDSPEQASASHDEMVTMLVFRGGSSTLKAVPLSLVTRLENIDASTIEWQGGRLVVQYRGSLMPLVACDEELRIKREGTQPLVVFSDGDLTLGLAVDQIVDIVEDKLDIELVADRTDLVGSAVIRGRATEVVNLAHYLPMVAEPWMKSGSRSKKGQTKSILLVDGSAFFRNSQAPVLKASGYRVITAANAAEAIEVLSSGTLVDVLVTDLDLPDRSGLDLIEAMRHSPRFADLPVIGLIVKNGPDQVSRARTLGIEELVAKMDRRGLLTALSELQLPLEKAA